MRKVGAMRNPSKAIVALVVAGLVVSMPVGALASVYSFYRITNNGNADVAGQLSVEVAAVGTAQVSFKFSNSGQIASTIADVYFDDGALLGIASITDSGDGVAFSHPATPADLPGGNLVGFETTVNFSADADNPVAKNGVDKLDEWVAIIFNLKERSPGVLMNFTDVIDAIERPTDDLSLRIGLHVQAIGTTGGSDGYVNLEDPAPGPNPVPEPTSLAVWGLGLAAAAFYRRRRV